MNDLVKMQDTLEIEYVDKIGVLDTLEMLVHICDEKSQHLQENWQDKNQYKEWDRIASILKTAGMKIS